VPVSRNVSANVSAKVSTGRTARPAGRYLVRDGVHWIFQLRVPATLAGGRKSPPILRVRLGVLTRSQARRKAEALASLARRVFEQEELRMRTGDADGNVGSEEWLAAMREIIGYGLLKVEHITPKAHPLQEAKFEAYRGLGRILDELLKGDDANQLVVSHQDRLRAVYAERLNALGNLSDVLETNADDDRLYDALANLPGAAG
jgi:hypothetical protein